MCSRVRIPHTTCRVFFATTADENVTSTAQYSCGFPSLTSNGKKHRSPLLKVVTWTLSSSHGETVQYVDEHILEFSLRESVFWDLGSLISYVKVRSVERFKATTLPVPALSQSLDMLVVKRVKHIMAVTLPEVSSVSCAVVCPPRECTYGKSAPHGHLPDVATKCWV